MNYQEENKQPKKSKNPFAWWVRGHTEAISAGLNLPSKKYSPGVIKASSGRISQHFTALHAPRDLHAPGAPDMADFDQVLQHWGIIRAELPAVIKTMKLQLHF